ncbi:MAG TPA: S53 family serine peptidase [Solirubrobacteraceae bacterium]
MRVWGVTAIVAAVLAMYAPAALAAGPVAQATRVGPVPRGEQLQLVLPLDADLAGIQSFAESVTTPGSPEYRQFESIPELAARFGASPATSARVISYLRAAGASDVKLDATGLFVDATMSAPRAAHVFTTPLAVFHSAREGRFVAPTTTAHVPAALSGLVTTVVGLDTRSLSTSSFVHATKETRAKIKAHTAAQPTSAAPLTGTPTGCAPALAAQGFTPDQYEQAYGFGPLYASGVRGQGERVALIEIDGFHGTDITTFASCFGLDVPRLNAFGVGIKHALRPGGEATLDLEVLDAAAPDLKAIDVYETKPSAADTLRALTAPLQHRGFKPQVISASLGLCEPDVFLAIGVRGLRSVEGSLAMAAASGISFLASSGDQGSADCVGITGQPVDRLAVNYPSSSPWVTGVGGTNLALTPSNTIAGQIVWNDTSLQPGAAGGGGTSALFRRPSYQNHTVKRNRRSVPDVSMLADIVPGYTVFCTATSDCVNAESPNPWQTVGGTSASTPLLAGGLALVDQDLRLNGRRDVGFANPLLYKVGRSRTLSSTVFSDVLAFGNDVGPYIAGRHRSLGCCSAGRGYDRASGWGSVNLANLAFVAVSLTHPRIGLSLPRHQHPARRGVVLARVSCSGACRVSAYALVRVGGARPFKIRSRIATIGGRGRLTFGMHFGRKGVRKVRSGLRHHHGVVITVYGRLYGSGRHIVKRTHSKTIRIHP